MKKGLLVLTLLSMVLGQKLDTLYKDIEGVLLISSLNGAETFTVNDSLLKRGYLPASTFKIPHTLIALETGLIEKSSDIFAWDSVDRAYEPWNRDHTVETAFKKSCVWCYQQLAEQLSDSVYLSFLKKLEYGNELTGENLTNFWLDGDIRVSVHQQVDFLKRIYSGTLPVSQKNINLLKDIMIIEQTSEYTLRGKSGWAGENGWFTGYLETQKDVWFFANRIRIRDKSQLALRKGLVMKSLRNVGILNK